MSGWGTVQPRIISSMTAGSSPRPARARAVTSAARSRLDTSAGAPCHLVNGELQANPAGMATLLYRMRPLPRGRDDLLRDWIAVEKLDQFRPVGQNTPLVHVTLVGDLAVVQAGRLGRHDEPLNAAG